MLRAPQCPSDEYYLERQAQPVVPSPARQSLHAAAADRNMNVFGEDGEQQSGQPEACRPVCPGKQQTHRAEKFEGAAQVDQIEMGR